MGVYGSTEQRMQCPRQLACKYTTNLSNFSTPVNARASERTGRREIIIAIAATPHRLFLRSHSPMLTGTLSTQATSSAPSETCSCTLLVPVKTSGEIHIGFLCRSSSRANATHQCRHPVARSPLQTPQGSNVHLGRSASQVASAGVPNRRSNRGKGSSG